MENDKLIQDVQREAFITWLNSRGVRLTLFDICLKPVNSFRFLYPRRRGRHIEIVGWNPDKTEVLHTIYAPETSFPLLTTRVMIHAQWRARNQWILGHRYGEGHLRRKRNNRIPPFPADPAPGELFHILRAADGRLLTYPGCDIVWTVPGWEEAQALSSVIGREEELPYDIRYAHFRPFAVLEDDAPVLLSHRQTHAAGVIIQTPSGLYRQAA